MSIQSAKPGLLVSTSTFLHMHVVHTSLSFCFVASRTIILRSYWSNFTHVMLDIIDYLLRQGTFVGHNMSNVRHIIMSRGKNATYFLHIKC